MSVQLLSQCPDQLHIEGYLDSAVVYMTDAFVPRRHHHTMGGGQNSMPDLWENVLTVWDQLGKRLGKRRKDVCLELFDCLTMQAQRWEESIKMTSESEGKDLRNFLAFMARMYQYESSGDRDKFLKDNRWVYAVENMDEEERDFVVAVEKNTMRRCFCLFGAENRIALVPDHAEIGDRLAILKGGPVPLVLRQLPEGAVEDAKAYEIVGDAYVSGMMTGEVLQSDGFAWEQIVLL